MDLPRLRQTLRRLRMIPFDRDNDFNVQSVPQEMLDYLAMSCGAKPVYLMGRGFDDRRWIEGVTALADKQGLYLARGKKWNAEQPHAEAPAWYLEFEEARKTSDTAIYISTSREVMDMADGCCRNGVTIEQEAYLLGYPTCCVQTHYERNRLYDKAFFMALRRVSGGDEEKMKQIVRDDVQMTPSEEESALFQRALKLEWAPYTSFSMCDACINDADSPAMQLSRKYRELAERIDSSLAGAIRSSIFPK